MPRDLAGADQPDRAQGAGFCATAAFVEIAFAGC
jgi:hypothetical protein